MVALFTTIRPKDFDRAIAEERFEEGAAAYRDVPGLRSKAFWLDEGAREVGGFYIFDDDASANAFLQSERYRRAVPKIWGAAPECRRLDIPVIVQNELTLPKR